MLVLAETNLPFVDVRSRLLRPSFPLFIFLALI